MPFFLERVGVVCDTENINPGGDQFPFLFLALGWGEVAFDRDRSSGGELLDFGINLI